MALHCSGLAVTALLKQSNRPSDLLWLLQGVYTPSIIDNHTIGVYKGGIGNATSTLYTGMNTTLQGFRDAAYAGELTRLPPATWAALNTNITQAAGRARNITNLKTSQTGAPLCMMWLVSSRSSHPPDQGHLHLPSALAPEYI